MPLVELIRVGVLAPSAFHGDDTTVSVLAKNKTPPARFLDLCARGSAAR
jgi:hypothetical protein